MTAIKKCFIPSAGYGTRFLPVTKSVPKELLPLGTKPIIQYSVEEAFHAGISDIVIIKNRLKNAIEDYFKISFEIKSFLTNKNKHSLLDSINTLIMNCNFSFVNQKKMLGLGNAISEIQSLSNDESFVVALPDDVCYSESFPVIGQLLEISKKFPDMCIIAIEEVEKEYVNNYGIVTLDDLEIAKDTFFVNGIIEKPDPESIDSNLAVIGRYILSNDIFEALKKIHPDQNGEIQLTDALQILVEKKKVLAYKFEGVRYDCGTFEGFLKANNFLFNQGNI